MFDSLPAESESQTEPSPAAEPAARVDEISTPAAPVAIPEPPRYDELMPWEEYALLEAAQAAAAANEPDHVADAGALDEWESALEGEGGEAVPAWGDEETAEEVAFAPPPHLDDEGSMIPDEIPESPESIAADLSFPLDAFIIPPHTKRLPKGLEHTEAVQGEIAEELAYRLDAMAERLRSEGFPGLLVLDADHRPVDTLLAGVLAGYLAHEAEELDADGPQ